MIHGKDGLVDETGDDAEGIEAGHIDRRQHRDDAGMGRAEGIKIAKDKARMGMGRADNPQHQRIRGGDIIAERLGACDFRQTVKAADRGADIAGSFGRGRYSGPGLDHRVDDLAVARATAEHTAQRVLHHGGIRGPPVAQQRHGRDHHARRADPALRGLMRLKAVAQRLRLGVGLDQTGQCFHLRACGLLYRHQASADRRAIHQHGAGPAIARVAANLDILGPQPFAQGMGQAFAGGGGDLDHMAVEVKGGQIRCGALIHGPAPPALSPCEARGRRAWPPPPSCSRRCRAHPQSAPAAPDARAG